MQKLKTVILVCSPQPTMHSRYLCKMLHAAMQLSESSAASGGVLSQSSTLASSAVSGLRNCRARDKV